MVTAYFVRKLLENAGINPERFALDWASAAEAPLYVKLITDFTHKIQSIGPLGTAEGIPGEELATALLAARETASSMKLRTRFSRLALTIRKENDFSEQFIKNKFSEKLESAITDELEKQKQKAVEPPS